MRWELHLTQRPDRSLCSKRAAVRSRAQPRTCKWFPLTFIRFRSVNSSSRVKLSTQCYCIALKRWKENIQPKQSELCRHGNKVSQHESVLAHSGWKCVIFSHVATKPLLPSHHLPDLTPLDFFQLPKMNFSSWVVVVDPSFRSTM